MKKWIYEYLIEQRYHDVEEQIIRDKCDRVKVLLPLLDIISSASNSTTPLTDEELAKGKEAIDTFSLLW